MINKDKKVFLKHLHHQRSRNKIRLSRIKLNKKRKKEFLPIFQEKWISHNMSLKILKIMNALQIIK